MNFTKIIDNTWPKDVLVSSDILVDPTSFLDILPINCFLNWQKSQKAMIL